MKKNILFAYISEFLRDGYYVGLFILLPFIVNELHLNLFQAGILQATVNMLMVVLAVPIVYILIKLGTLKTLGISLFLYAISFSGIFFVRSFLSLLVFFIILGISFAFYAITASHIRLTWFSRETRGKEVGTLMAIGDIAKTLFSVLSGIFIGIVGWRFTTLSMGIISGILVILFCLFFMSFANHENSTEIEKEDPLHAPYRYFLKQKMFLLALVTNVLDEGANTPFYAFLPFLLLYKGVPPLFLGIFAGLYYFGNIISRLVFGRLVDTIGNAKILIMLELIMAFVTCILTLSSILLLTGVLALLLGFITEGTDPATNSMVADSLEHIENAHKASGIRITATGISKAVFPFLLGIIATKFGIIPAFYSLALLALLPIIPAILFMKAKKFSLS